MGKKLHPHYEYLETTETLMPGDLIYFEEIDIGGTLIVVDHFNQRLGVLDTDTEAEWVMPIHILGEYEVFLVNDGNQKPLLWLKY